jgi:DNA-binding MarR family transcriptional regulator
VSKEKDMPKDQPRLHDAPPLDVRVSYRISRLNARLNAQAGRILKASADISLSQWRILVMINEAGEITASDIARQTKIDKALISRAIRSLADEGLIAADIQASDHRSHLIRFTDLGRARFHEALPHMLARQNGIVAGLSGEEQDQFFSMLTRIEEAIEAMDTAS